MLLCLQTHLWLSALLEGSSTSISSWDQLLRTWFSSTLRSVEKCSWHMEQCLVTQSCQYLVVSVGGAGRALSWSICTKPQLQILGKAGVCLSICESLSECHRQLAVQCTLQPLLQYVSMGCTKGMQWLERYLSKLTPLWVSQFYSLCCMTWLHFDAAGQENKLGIAQMGMFGNFTYAGFQRYWMDFEVFKPLFASGIACWFWSHQAVFY